MAAAKSSEKLLRLFISYSRRNKEVMQAIKSALEAESFEVTIDTSDLQSGDAWRPQLLELIRDADSVVFLTTDASIGSEICHWELDQCVRLSKRIMPIRVESITKEIPPQLGAIHFLPATGLFALDRDLPALVKALTTDRQWLRQSTQYAERARQWAEAERAHKRRASSFLLSGNALAAAETWKSRRSATAPEISREIQDFLHASRKREGQRQRFVAGTALGVLAVAGTLAGIAYVQVQTRIAERDAGLVTQSNRLADAAYQQISSGDAATGLLLALEGLPSGEPGDERKLVKVTENMVLAGLLNLRERDVIDVRGGAVVSPDGTRVAYGTGDNKVRIVDIKTKALVIEFTYDGVPESLSFSPDGKRLVTLSDSSKIQVWDVRTGRALVTLTNDNRFGSVTFSPDGGKLIFTNGSGRNRYAETKGGEINHGAMIFDMTTLRRTALISHPAKVFRAVMSKDGRIIATAAEDKRVRVFDAVAGRLLRELPEHRQNILDIALTRDGAYVVSGSEDGAWLWRTDTGALEDKFVSQADSWFWAVGTSADGGQALTNTGDEVTAWSIETGRRTWRVKTYVKQLAQAFTDTAEGFSLDQSEGTLVTAHVDDSLRIWNVGPLVLAPQVIETGCAKALRLQASRDASIIVTLCEESGAVQGWDGESGQRHFTLKGLTVRPEDIVLAPDGATLAVSSKTDGLRLFSPRTGRALLSMAHKGEQPSTAFDSRGDRLALGLDDGRIRIWKRTSESWAAEPRLVNAGGKGIACLAFGPSGDRLLSVSTDGTPHLWNTETGAQIALLRVPGEPAAEDRDRWTIRCAYAPDGKTVAVDLSGALQIWDADAHTRLSHTQQSFGSPYALDYSPDSRRLLWAGGNLESVRVIEVPSGRYLPSNDGSGVGALVIDGDSDVMAITTLHDSNVKATKTVGGIRLIDLQTQRDLKTIDADAEDLHLSVGAGRLVAAMRDGKVQIWPIPPGGAARILAARRAVPRCLTFPQRSEAGLPPLPPRWCITGADHVASKDPALWAGKWPYHTKEWRDWLAARDRGESPDPPDFNEYSPKVGTGKQ
jgi:WD40 repeat protein